MWTYLWKELDQNIPHISKNIHFSNSFFRISEKTITKLKIKDKKMEWKKINELRKGVCWYFLRHDASELVRGGEWGFEVVEHDTNLRSRPCRLCCCGSNWRMKNKNKIMSSLLVSLCSRLSFYHGLNLRFRLHHLLVSCSLIIHMWWSRYEGNAH